MAIARTGVYVDDYLEYASTLPAELQRLLNTIRELDERSQSMINQTGQQTKYCLGLASQSSKKGNSNNSCSYYYNNNNNSQEDEVAIEKMLKDIDSSQDNALSLCTEKVLLARQAYDLLWGRGRWTGGLTDQVFAPALQHTGGGPALGGFPIPASVATQIEKLYRDFLWSGIGDDFKFHLVKWTKIDSHVKRLDEDLNNFAEDLKQEGKIAPDEPAILPPLPIVPKSEKRKPFYVTPQSKRMDYREREWDRERDRDFELMPPPGSHKKEFAAPVDVDQPIDPNEPTYCVCHQVSFGDMIACDNENCQGGEWFHYTCVGLTPETRFRGKWYCPTCKLLPECQ